MLKTITTCSEDDEREEAISSGGLDLIVVPGLGFTKVSLCLVTGRTGISKFCRISSNMIFFYICQKRSVEEKEKRDPFSDEQLISSTLKMITSHFGLTLVWYTFTLSVAQKPGARFTQVLEPFGLAKPFVDNLNLETEWCMHVKLLVGREPLFVLRICE